MILGLVPDWTEGQISSSREQSDVDESSSD